MRIEQEEESLNHKEHAPKTQKAHAYAKKQMRWHNAGIATQAQKLACLHQKSHAHTQRNTCTYIKKYMHLRQGTHVLL